MFVLSLTGLDKWNRSIISLFKLSLFSMRNTGIKQNWMTCYLLTTQILLVCLQNQGDSDSERTSYFFLLLLSLLDGPDSNRDPHHTPNTHRPARRGRIAQSRWMLVRILGSGRTRSVSFWPFRNSSGWWWLISSVFLIRSPVIKQLMQMVTMEPGHGGWFQSLCFP